MSNLFRQEFQGDEPTKVSVLGFVDHTHPAATQLFQDAVMEMIWPISWEGDDTAGMLRPRSELSSRWDSAEADR
jgi:hypothetical protein